MQRFLTFPDIQRDRSPNPLTDYLLSGGQLLPDHFGPVAPVNIFLGENNSGKSRFMREIMRDKVAIIPVDLEIEAVRTAIRRLKTSSVDAKLEGIIVSAQIRYQNIPYDEAHKPIIDFFWKGETNYNSYSNQNIDVEEVTATLLQPLLDLKNKIGLIDDLIILLSRDKKLSSVEQSLNTLSHFFDSLFSLLNTFTGEGGYRVRHDYAGFEIQVAGAVVRLQGVQVVTPSYQQTTIVAALAETLRTVLRNIADMSQQVKYIRQFFKDIVNGISSPASRTYVPTLRSARTLLTKGTTRLETDNDIFHHTTTRDYQLADTGVEVNTGFRLYDAIDTTRNARREGRNVFGEFEQFLSDTFFNHKKVEVVAERVRDAHGGSILVAVEGVEHEIHNLGDGIQAIIMLLYPLFIAAEGAWFFIEEPETHLHPGFQRLFIETITTNEILRAKNLTIFLTTHSNHMLDFALEAERQVNIYTFRRRAGTGSKSTYEIQLSSPRDIHNLNTLGVQNSSVFLANCSIWVEGITDRLYFRAYLAAYLDHLKVQLDNKQPVSLLEGLHYTFLEYSGGNVSHYNFSELEGPFTPKLLDDIRALSIANRVMLVADQDAGKNTRHQARENQQHAGFTYHILGCREVENLLSPKLIVKGLAKLFSQHTFDANLLKPTEYRQKYLGSYIRQQHPSIKLPASFTAESGTIGSSYKRKFAEAVVAPPLVWDDLSRAAQDFTKQLYGFIIAHNPRLGSN